MRNKFTAITVALLLMFVFGLSPCFSETPQEPADDLDWFPAGEYWVGTDIPPGEYFLEATEMSERVYLFQQPGDLQYIIEELDAEGNLTHVLSSDFRMFGFISVEDGQRLTVKNARIIASDKAPKITTVDGYYGEGLYRIGKDIPKGEYYCEKVGVYSVSDISVRDNLQYEHGDKSYYGTRVPTFAFLTVDKGVYLFARGVRMIPSGQAPKIISNNGIYKEGGYRIGKDIPEGEYRLMPYKDFGSYSIYSSTSLTNIFSQMSNLIRINNFESSVTVEALDGQYLVVSFATLERVGDLSWAAAHYATLQGIVRAMYLGLGIALLVGILIAVLFHLYKKLEVFIK